MSDKNNPQDNENHFKKEDFKKIVKKLCENTGYLNSTIAENLVVALNRDSFSKTRSYLGIVKKGPISIKDLRLALSDSFYFNSNKRLVNNENKAYFELNRSNYLFLEQDNNKVVSEKQLQVEN